MAVKSGVAISAVLPLPPMEYDVNYMNNLIRILNFFIQQVQSPSLVKGNALTIEDRDQSTKLTVNPSDLKDLLVVIATNLPTSSSGLSSGQLWVDTASGNVLKIVP